MSKWQPIETAPKDGRKILVFGPSGNKNGGVIEVAYWEASGDSWADKNGIPCEAGTGSIQTTGSWFSGGGWFQPNEVSHWMPLPESPR